mmetsp:Transcript_3707/g.10450  ORF Transcript_3707/g.10450 Transcript_3707/m.10450 type:complete len:220 (+) Transcript_3707:1477-2136(+)
MHRQHMLLGHVAEERQLLAHRVLEWLLAAARQHVGIDAQRAERLHTVLAWLCLLLAHHAQNWHQAHMHEKHVLGADAELELPQRLDKRHALNVAHGSSELDDTHVWDAVLTVDRGVGHARDPLLDGVRDVGDNLHRLAQVIAAPFALDHVLVDLSRRDVVVLGKRDVQEPFVVAKVKVCLAAVIQHKHLAVLERRHRAGVHVEVWVDFDAGDAEAAVLE